MLIVIMVVFCIGLFCIFPERKRRAYCRAMFNRPYTHRGYHTDLIPENSLPAFLLAKKKGYGIELDVQKTKDHQVVIFHDFELGRIVRDEYNRPVQGRIEQYTLAQLKQFRLLDTQSKICTLEECLACVNGEVPILIEYKVKHKDSELCKLCQQILSKYEGQYCIESFHPYPMYWYRKHAPHVLRGQLTEPHLKENPNVRPRILYLALTYLCFNFLSRPDFIAYNCRYRKNVVVWFLHRVLKTPTIAWTLQSEAQKEQLKQEADAYIFEGFDA